MKTEHEKLKQKLQMLEGGLLKIEKVNEALCKKIQVLEETTKLAYQTYFTDSPRQIMDRESQRKPERKYDYCCICM
jgi:hypothetical protein